MTKVTLEFLQGLLKDEYPDVTIQSYEGAPGSKRGDNYTSMVYRITLCGVRKKIEPDGSSETTVPWEGSIIYKCLPESTLLREAFKSDELFCNEVAFYNKIWPVLVNFQQKKGVEPFKAIPHCYLAQNDLVVLKDLKQFGYIMPDRREGLTVEQCYFVLKHLSHFHALSLALKYESPDEFFELLNIQDGVSEVFFVPENEEYYKSYYREATQNAIALVEEELKDEDDAAHYIEKFRSFCGDSFFQTMVELVSPREPLAVICHGDCWTNNLLFKYVGGELSDMYLVDFQLARFASPTLDLVYLMYLCLERAQRSQHLSSLLEYYVDELHQALQLLTDEGTAARNKLDKDSLHELVCAEFRRSSRFGLGIALDMYPIMTCDSHEAPNLYQRQTEAPLSHEQSQPVWTTNTACRRKMTDLVRELVDEGLL